MKPALLAGLCAVALSVHVVAQSPAAGEIPPILLKFAAIEPGSGPIEVAALLRGSDDTRLWIVQLADHPTDAMRNAIVESGGELHGYLPENAYVVRMPTGTAATVRELRDVRSVSYYHPAFRLESVLRDELLRGGAPVRSYNIVVVDKHRDKLVLARRILAIGGVIDDEGGGSLLFQATLDNAQLLQVSRFDEVLWIDRWSAPEDDMDNARIQGGGNYVETVGGYTGRGIIGHQMEGLNPNHVDWTNPPISHPAGCNAVDSHGHNTAGIVYGNGTSLPAARGMAPDAQAVYTSCRTNRWNNIQSLIAQQQIMFTTASWGSALTRAYTSVSAEADDICFDHDIVWTNSQSNAHNQDSRAEAWAKNVFSIGGVHHFDNSNPADDSWLSGGASIGPAADGRTKPDLCAYYDNIATSASNGSYTLTFGGTSGATPIVAGHNALAIQMYTDGVFGNPLRVPGGTRFQNRPHFTTLKALQIANAVQYPFTASSTDNRREHQGYGFPNLRSMWDNRGVMFIVDEDDVIVQGTGIAYTLAVPAGRAELKVTMSYSDPAANPSAAIARINDLTLRVTAPDGTRYWGNAGMTGGLYTTTGGDRDRLNTTENVFVRSPMAGNWVVDVIAYVVAQDSHIETAAVDADFGLTANGATFVSKRPITVQVGTIQPFGQGCAGSVILPSYCASLNANGGTLTRDARSWEYAYRATTASALQVVGFELWTASVGGGTVVAPAAIYASTGTAPNTVALATTTMTVTGTEGFHRANFAAPVTIPGGSTFYVAITHNNTVYVSTLTAGAAGQGYYRSTGAWTASGLTNAPSYRILCAGGGGQRAVPQFDLAGSAEIGSDLAAQVSLAAANAPAALLIGVSNSSWSGVGLPFDLGPAGAPGCLVYVSLDATIGFTTTAGGGIQANMTIPNDVNLVGAQGFAQFAIVDGAANGFGVALTSAYAITFGQ